MPLSISVCACRDFQRSRVRRLGRRDDVDEDTMGLEKRSVPDGAVESKPGVRRYFEMIFSCKKDG